MVATGSCMVASTFMHIMVDSGRCRKWLQLAVVFLPWHIKVVKQTANCSCIWRPATLIFDIMQCPAKKSLVLRCPQSSRTPRNTVIAR
eukprot:156606-Pelagomonas_calceolata.AAC.1